MAQNIAGMVVTQPTPQSTKEACQGRVVYDSTAIVATDYTEINCGFLPDYVLWENISDLTRFEWYRGMAQDTCIKTAANGTRTLVGSGGITVLDGGRTFRMSQNATTAAVTASKTIAFLATAQ